MEDAVKKISTGAAGLDALLGGGIEPRMITQFFWRGGFGKEYALYDGSLFNPSRR